MGTGTTFGVDQDNRCAVQQTKGDQPLLTVRLPDVFTGDRKVVPDDFAPDEVNAVILDILPALRFAPGSHAFIVFTKYLLCKGIG